MVNALMRMKRHEQRMMEEVMTVLNVPTRREMDTAHKRVYELQRQLSGLQDAMAESGAAQDAAPARARTRTSPVQKSTAKKTATRRITSYNVCYTKLLRQIV